MSNNKMLLFMNYIYVMCVCLFKFCVLCWLCTCVCVKFVNEITRINLVIEILRDR